MSKPRRYKLFPKQKQGWCLLEDPALRRILFDGGARSGKTDVALVWLIKEAMSRPGARILAARRRLDGQLLRQPFNLGALHRVGKGVRQRQRQHRADAIGADKVGPRRARLLRGGIKQRFAHLRKPRPAVFGTGSGAFGIGGGIGGAMGQSGRPGKIKRLGQRLPIAIVVGKVGGGRLTRMTDAEREDQTVQRDAAARLDGGKELGH